jgi:anti-anti-sigma factor
MKLTLQSRAADLTRIACEGHVTQVTLHATDPLEAVLSPGTYADSILMDLSRAQFIDSSGVGWMLKCHKHCKQAGGRIVFHSAPPLVRQTLDLLQMGKVLHLAKDAKSGSALLFDDHLQVQVKSSANGLQRLRIIGYLAEAQLNAHPEKDPLECAITSAGYSQRLLLDLSALTKLDAAGIAWLAKTQQRGAAAGGEVIYYSLPSALRGVIDTSTGGEFLQIADNEADAALQLKGR